MGQVNWARTRDILICVIAIGLIFSTAWSVLGHFVEAIVIMLLSMAVAFLLTPMVDLLTKRNIPRILSTAIVYIVVLALLVFLGYELIITLINQANAFSATVVNYFTNLPGWLQQGRDELIKQGIPRDRIDSTIADISNQATRFAQTAATDAVNLFFVILGAFLNIFLVLVVSFYLTLDGKRIRDSLVSIVPKRWLPNVLLFEQALSRVVGSYIRGQLTLATIIGIMAGLVCLMFGMGNYALIVGVLAFLFETIPMVGPALASIPAILLSLLLPEPFPRTIWVILAFVVIQTVESNILGPRIVGHAVGLHPIAAILALLVGAELFGIFGALIATPIVAAIWVVIASFYRSFRGETPDQMLARKRAPWTLRRPGQLGKKPDGDPPLRGESTSDVAAVPPDLERVVGRSKAKDEPSVAT